jgi:hypothetical protein
MRQALTPNDLVEFAQYPNLRSLSGNISELLGTPWHSEITHTFPFKLTLGTRFDFDQEFSDTVGQRRILARIVQCVHDPRQQDPTETNRAAYSLKFAPLG